MLPSSTSLPALGIPSLALQIDLISAYLCTPLWKAGEESTLVKARLFSSPAHGPGSISPCSPTSALAFASNSGRWGLSYLSPQRVWLTIFCLLGQPALCKPVSYHEIWLGIEAWLEARLEQWDEGVARARAVAQLKSPSLA